MTGQADQLGYLIITGRTDTKIEKTPYHWPKEICAWCCAVVKNRPFVSLNSGRKYCSEACCVHREVGEK